MKLQAFLLAFLSATSSVEQQPPTPPPTDPKSLGTIEGRVTAADGQPLRKATLILRPLQTKPGEPVTPLSTVSAADGKFVFKDMDPGRYMLTADHPRYMTTSYGAKANPLQGAPFTLSAGQKMSEIVIQMVPQTSISGTITDDEGDPAPRVQVSALRQNFAMGGKRLMIFGSATTDDNGDFKISNLGPGKYYLQATPQRVGNMFGENVRKVGVDPNQPEEDLVASYYPGVADQTSAAQINVVAGRDLPGTNVKLRKAQVFHVRGQVGGSAGEAEGRNLRVVATQRGAVYMGFGAHAAMVKKDGSFDISGIPAGSYTLSVMSAQGTMMNLASQPLEVANRNLDGLTMTMQPPGQLKGTVKVEGEPKPEDSKLAKSDSGSGFAGGRVSLLSTDGAVFSAPGAPIKPDGTFTIENFTAGKYRVTVYVALAGAYLKSARVGNQDALDGADIQPGSALEVVFSYSAGQVNGTVQAEAQQNVQGTAVSLVPDPPEPEKTYLYRNAVAGANGQFTMKGIAPGKYRLYAWEELEPGAHFDPTFIKAMEGKGVKVSVDENSQQQFTVTRIPSAETGAVK